MQETKKKVRFVIKKAKDANVEPICDDEKVLRIVQEPVQGPKKMRRKEAGRKYNLIPPPKNLPEPLQIFSVQENP